MPALVAVLAGLIRGITGFGGAMVMAPPFALLLGAKIGLPVGMLLESLAAAPQMVQTRKLVRWRVVGPILAASLLTVPLGTYVLLTADALTLRRAAAVIVILFSIVLLFGWRYSGAHRLSTGLALGGLSGAMVGATSIGGPPVILYLLAGPDPIGVTRANLTLFVGAVSIIPFVMLLAAGAVDPAVAWIGLLFAPGYYGGLLAGTRLFAHFNDTRFRHFTLLLMIAVSTGILLA